MKFSINVGGLDQAISMLQMLPANVVSKKGGPVKNALRKAAHVIANEEKSLFASRLNEHGWNDTTGVLAKSIIVSRGKKPMNTRGERYLVRIKRKTYNKPDRSTNGKPVTTLKVAQIFEYGSEHQPARPFIRTAFRSKAEEAIRVFRDDLYRRIDMLVKRYGLSEQPDDSLSL